MSWVVCGGGGSSDGGGGVSVSASGFVLTVVVLLIKSMEMDGEVEYQTFRVSNFSLVKLESIFLGRGREIKI